MLSGRRFQYFFNHFLGLPINTHPHIEYIIVCLDKLKQLKQRFSASFMVAVIGFGKEEDAHCIPTCKVVKTLLKCAVLTGSRPHETTTKYAYLSTLVSHRGVLPSCDFVVVCNRETHVRSRRMDLPWSPWKLPPQLLPRKTFPGP
mmetsp:Transcript_22184/g.39966  ORF Transcript_22184/g.39966 Transcript_22184/m.39966 type:complete len:145 (-) Transcript_22184:714-1148(-)